MCVAQVKEGQRTTCAQTAQRREGAKQHAPQERGGTLNRRQPRDVVFTQFSFDFFFSCFFFDQDFFYYFNFLIFLFFSFFGFSNFCFV